MDPKLYSEVTAFVDLLEFILSNSASNSKPKDEHDFFHQVLAKIGPEKLAHQIKMHDILDALDASTQSHAQQIAVLRFLHHIKTKNACDKCLALSYDILDVLRASYDEFTAKVETEK